MLVRVALAIACSNAAVAGAGISGCAATGAAFVPTGPGGRLGRLLRPTSQAQALASCALPRPGWVPPVTSRPWARQAAHGIVMAHTLSAEQQARNKELNAERKAKNLAIAARVAAGELRPIVVSFSPAMREQLRLAKRYKHTRIFVETHEVQSLAALQQALLREIPHPLAQLPADAFSLAVRPPAADDADEAPEADWDTLTTLSTDAELQAAYARAQDARASGVGKLRVCVADTPAFQSFLDERRGYALDADGGLPGGLSPADASHWVMTSFYTLRPVASVEDLCKRLVSAWLPLGVLGRVYVAEEGVNAQVSVPDNMAALFAETVAAVPELEGVYLNTDEPLPMTEQPFAKLQVKPRKQVLADGLGPHVRYDWANNGRKLTPAEWHEKMALVQRGDARAPLVLDVRNFYESEVGRFVGAAPLDTATFRETWDAFKEKLAGVEQDREILTYCTGGIRCEKANAYLIQELGFKNVGALKGGIVNYAQYTTEAGLESSFAGVNHVFDQRLGQRVGSQVLARCISCGVKSDVQTDCLNTHCPRPFARRRYVQCEDCAVELRGCCTAACADECAGRAEHAEAVQALEGVRKALRVERQRQQQRARTRADLAAKAAAAAAGGEEQHVSLGGGAGEEAEEAGGEAAVAGLEAEEKEVEARVAALAAQVDVLHARSEVEVKAAVDAEDKAVVCTCHDRHRAAPAIVL